MEGVEGVSAFVCRVGRMVRGVEARVGGEVSSSVLSRAGHLYVELKERDTSLSVVFFSAPEKAVRAAKEGKKIVVTGKAAVYARQSRLQVVATEIAKQKEEGETDGEEAEKEGEAAKKRRQALESLAEEGIVGRERRRLPLFPSRLFLITSAGSAAEADFEEGVMRKWPGLGLRRIDACVQGKTAVRDVVEGISEAIGEGADVIVVARGGGSKTDLEAFEEEDVARAIWEASKRGAVVVSAVGHETDTTLADLVADVRCKTPSAAAEAVVPDVRELRRKVKEGRKMASKAVWKRVEEMREKVERARGDAEGAPQKAIERLRRRVGEARVRGKAAARGGIGKGRKRVWEERRRAEACLPGRVGVVREGGEEVVRVGQLRSGEKIQIVGADGFVWAVVEG